MCLPRSGRHMQNVTSMSGRIAGQTLLLEIALHGVIAAAPAIAALGLVAWMAGVVPQRPQSISSHFIDVLVFAPWIETAFMAPVFWLLRRARCSPEALAVLSAAAWSLIHSLKNPLSGPVVFWPFWIFSRVFLKQSTHGLTRAFGVTGVVHTLANGLTSLAEVQAWE